MVPTFLGVPKSWIRKKSSSLSGGQFLASDHGAEVPQVEEDVVAPEPLGLVGWGEAPTVVRGKLEVVKELLRKILQHHALASTHLETDLVS